MVHCMAPIRGSVIDLMAALRKRLMAETVSTLSIRNLYVPAFVELLKIYGPEKTIKTFFRWGFQMGHDFMLELRKSAEKIKMHNPSERAAVARAAWYMFLGTKPEVKVWEEEIAGEKLFFIRIIDRDSPITRGVTLSARVPLCSYAAGAYEGATQTVFALQEANYFALTREIKCRAASDKHCEIIVVDVPMEVLDRVAPELERRFPGFFKYIDLEFSKKLREMTTI